MYILFLEGGALMNKFKLARLADISIIEMDTTASDVEDFCKKWREYPCAGIAVDLAYVPLAQEMLKGTGIHVVTTIAYPLGGMTKETMMRQARWAVENGADEMDVSIDVGALIDGRYDEVYDKLKSVVDVAAGRITKAVIYTAKLSPEQSLIATDIAIRAGTRFVKTNSGFGLITEPEHVRNIKDTFGHRIKVMAAGGIRTQERVMQMIQAGADRFATSTPCKVFGLVGGEAK